jgi:hypothetical protein
VTVLLPSSGLPYWVALGVGSVGLLCLAALSRHLRPDLRGPLYAGDLLFRPRLLTPLGRMLWLTGWLCLLYFNVMLWGSLMFI